MARPARDELIKRIREGRPSSLSQEAIEKTSHAIELGMPIEMAVIYAGYARSSFYRWKDASEAANRKIDSDGIESLTEDELMHVQFWDRIKRAEANFIQDNVTEIKGHGKKEWTALAWLLQHRAKEYFGKEAELTNPNQNPSIVMQDSK